MGGSNSKNQQIGGMPSHSIQPTYSSVESENSCGFVSLAQSSNLRSELKFIEHQFNLPENYFPILSSKASRCQLTSLLTKEAFSQKVNGVHRDPHYVDNTDQEERKKIENSNVNPLFNEFQEEFIKLLYSETLADVWILVKSSQSIENTDNLQFYGLNENLNSEINLGSESNKNSNVHPNDKSKSSSSSLLSVPKQSSGFFNIFTSKLFVYPFLKHRIYTTTTILPTTTISPWIRIPAHGSLLWRSKYFKEKIIELNKNNKKNQNNNNNQTYSSSSPNMIEIEVPWTERQTRLILEYIYIGGFLKYYSPPPIYSLNSTPTPTTTSNNNSGSTVDVSQIPITITTSSNTFQDPDTTTTTTTTSTTTTSSIINDNLSIVPTNLTTTSTTESASPPPIPSTLSTPTLPSSPTSSPSIEFQTRPTTQPIFKRLSIKETPYLPYHLLELMGLCSEIGIEDFEFYLFEIFRNEIENNPIIPIDYIRIIHSNPFINTFLNLNPILNQLLTNYWIYKWQFLPDVVQYINNNRGNNNKKSIFFEGIKVLYQNDSRTLRLNHYLKELHNQPFNFSYFEDYDFKSVYKYDFTIYSNSSSSPSSSSSITTTTTSTSSSSMVSKSFFHKILLYCRVGFFEGFFKYDNGFSKKEIRFKESNHSIENIKRIIYFGKIQNVLLNQKELLETFNLSNYLGIQNLQYKLVPSSNVISSQLNHSNILELLQTFLLLKFMSQVHICLDWILREFRFNDLSRINYISSYSSLFDIQKHQFPSILSKKIKVYLKFLPKYLQKIFMEQNPELFGDGSQNQEQNCLFDDEQLVKIKFIDFLKLIVFIPGMIIQPIYTFRSNIIYNQYIDSSIHVNLISIPSKASRDFFSGLSEVRLCIYSNIRIPLLYDTEQNNNSLYQHIINQKPQKFPDSRDRRACENCILYFTFNDRSSFEFLRIAHQEVVNNWNRWFPDKPGIFLVVADKVIEDPTKQQVSREEAIDFSIEIDSPYIEVALDIRLNTSDIPIYLLQERIRKTKPVKNI